MSSYSISSGTYKKYSPKTGDNTHDSCDDHLQEISIKITDIQEVQGSVWEIWLICGIFTRMDRL